MVCEAKVTHVETETRRMGQYKDLPEETAGTAAPRPRETAPR